MDEIKRLFGDRVKLLRKIRCLTQEQLAECLGLNVRQISRIESGESFVSLDTLKMLSVILNVNLGELMNISISPARILLSCPDKILHYTAQMTERGVQFSKTGSSEIFYIQKFSCRKKEEKLCRLAKKYNQPVIIAFMENGKITTDVIYFTNGDFIVCDRIQFAQMEDKLMKLFEEIIKLSQNEMMFDFICTSVKACKNPALRKNMRVLLDGMDMADKMK